MRQGRHKAHDASQRRASAAPPESFIQYSNIAAWLAVGAAVGWLSTLVQPAAGRVAFIETLGVAVFGSFIGGEFVAAMVRGSSAGTALSFGAVALAAGCSVAALAALALMRRAVGPLRPGKSKIRR